MILFCYFIIVLGEQYLILKYLTVIWFDILGHENSQHLDSGEILRHVHSSKKLNTTILELNYKLYIPHSNIDLAWITISSWEMKICAAIDSWVTILAYTMECWITVWHYGIRTLNININWYGLITPVVLWHTSVYCSGGFNFVKVLPGGDWWCYTSDLEKVMWFIHSSEIFWPIVYCSSLVLILKLVYGNAWLKVIIA